jgi:hypothetical protein
MIPGCRVRGTHFGRLSRRPPSQQVYYFIECTGVAYTNVFDIAGASFTYDNTFWGRRAHCSERVLGRECCCPGPPPVQPRPTIT